jgi:16S rRNA C1402 (ribose-2'-O) methylase RsmI
MQTSILIDKDYDLTVEKQRQNLFSFLQNQISGFISKKLSATKEKLKLLEKIKKVFIETLHYIENILEKIEEACPTTLKKVFRQYNKKIVSLEQLLSEM